MGLIQNLVARLTMDSTAFDRNAKDASKSLYGMVQQTRATQQAFAGMAAAGVKIAAVTAAAYAAYRGLKSLAAATIEAERSEQTMISALRVRGQVTESTVDVLRRQAEAMQDVTRFSRNEIEQAQALALTMGAGVPELEKMTEAAVGLSVAYNRDLLAAMRLVSLARQGETGQLKEMGIVLDRSRTKQQQYVQLQELGRKQMDRAKRDAQTLGGSIAQLGNEWAATKDAMVRPFVPALVGALKAIREGLEAVQKSANAASNAVSLFSDSADPLMLEGMASGYKRGGVGTGKRLQFGDEVRLRLNEEGKVKAESLHPSTAMGSDGAAAVIPAAQREQIVRLNEQIKEQIAIQREANSGNLQAAETIRYLAAAEEVYGKGTQETEGAMLKFNSAMQVLNDLKSRAAASEYLQELKDENDIISLQHQGLTDQAEIQQVLNNFRKQGITLTAEETAALAKQIELNREMQEHYGTIGEGLTGWLREAQDQMKTLGDLAYDLGKKLQEGVVDSLADAVFEGESLEDMLQQVLRDMAKMAFKQAMNTAYTQIASAFVGHEGGVIGSSGFATRRDGSAAWLGAPRLHDGLKSDEFRFIGQRGEKITSKSGVASETRLMGRMVTLLERMASRQNVANVQIVDKRQTPQEWFAGREGEKAWQVHAARNR